MESIPEVEYLRSRVIRESITLTIFACLVGATQNPRAEFGLQTIAELAYLAFGELELTFGEVEENSVIHLSNGRCVAETRGRLCFASSTQGSCVAFHPQNSPGALALSHSNRTNLVDPGTYVFQSVLEHSQKRGEQEGGQVQVTAQSLALPHSG